MKFAAACLFLLSLASAKPRETLSLEEALGRVLRTHPAVAAQASTARAEHARIRARGAPADPMLGLERARGMNVRTDSVMTSWMITQDLMFPSKYFSMAAAQRQKAYAADSGTLAKILELRTQLVGAYYRTVSLDRILALLEVQLGTTREIARVAEARRSTGAVPQQDEMKAHVEETRANAEILMAREEREMAFAELLSLLGDPAAGDEAPVKLESSELPMPKLALSPRELRQSAPDQFEKAPALIQAASVVEQLDAEKRLALMGWIPDFRLSYQAPLPSSKMDPAMPEYLFTVEASIPLWFFLKQGPSVTAARAELEMASKTREQTRRDLNARVTSLAARAEARSTLLKIDQTSLIPQATSTFNSSQAAYRAGRISLVELLDSQRALYATRIGYYRALMEYATTVAELEAVLGKSISDLPFPKQEELSP